MATKTQTPAEIIAEAKEKRARANAQIAEAKAAQDAAKEAEKAAKEQAKAAAEKARAEADKVTEQVKEELADIDSKINEQQMVKSRANQLIGALKEQRSEIAAKLPKGTRSTSGQPRVPRDPSKLTTIQNRIMAFMVNRKGASRQELVDAGNQKEGGTMDAQPIGSVSDPSMYPYSLLGRKLLSVETVELDGGRKVSMFSLTPEGKAAAKAAIKELNGRE